MRGSKLLGSLAALAAACSVAAAEDTRGLQARETLHIDVAAQPIEKALNEFARQSGVHVVINSRIAGSIESSAVIGSMRVEDALQRLLERTGLTYRLLDGETISVEKPIAQRTSSLLSVTGEGTQRADEAGILRLSQIDKTQTTDSEGTSNSSSPSSKEDGKSKISEIVVTAQKRSENLQDVPISISVLGGQELDSSTSSDVNEALQSVPGIDTSARDMFTGGVQISLRGVSNPIARAGGAGPVAYYVDSVPFGFVRHAVYPDAGSFDLSRVEVLNGPQGTLYGAGSLNGVVRVLTAEANPKSFEFKARASTSTTEGGGENHRGSVAVNVPLMDGRLAARFAVDAQEDDGWIDSPVERNVNDVERRDYRFKVRALLTDSLTVDLLAWRMESEDGAPSQSDPNQRISVTNDQPSSSQFDVYGIRAEQEFSNFTISSMSSWIDYTNFGKVDGAPTPITTQTFGVLDVRLYSRVFSEELNIVSTGDGPWRWSAGAFYRDAEDRTFQFLSFYVPPFNTLAQNDYTDTSESYAVYGEVGRRLNDELELSVGLRYFHDSQHTILNQQYNPPMGLVLPIGSTYESISEAVTPRAVFTWTPTEDQTYYASYSQGFRSGFSQQPNVQSVFPGFAPVDPDRLTNYEVGAKGNWLEDRVSYETAFYYIDWQDIQQNLRVDIPPLATTATLNAESASGFGASLGLTFEATDNLSLSGNVSWNGLAFDSDVHSGTTLLYREGDRITTSPEWTASFSAEYSWDLGGGFGASTSFAGNYHSSQTSPLSALGPVGRAEGPELFTGSARFSIDAPTNWSASLFVDNVTDEYDSAYVLLGGSAPEWVPRRQPRTYGVQLEYRFK